MKEKYRLVKELQLEVSIVLDFRFIWSVLEN